MTGRGFAALALAFWAVCAMGAPSVAQQSAGPSPQGDIPEHFTMGDPGANYVQREAMIPMRDGVRLHTVIIVPKDLHDAPMILDRTTYNASRVTHQNENTH